jgi:hypothetical protein
MNAGDSLSEPAVVHLGVVSITRTTARCEVSDIEAANQWAKQTYRKRGELALQCANDASRVS